MVIFEKGASGRHAYAQAPKLESTQTKVPSHFLRSDEIVWPECSELDVVRHYTQLSQKNYCIDTNFYPLGSCTMKYNPRGVHRLAMHTHFLGSHPLEPESMSASWLGLLYELQSDLKDLTGMSGVCLTPMAGAQGEFAGVAMIKAYHEANDDTERSEILVPDAAHGTNPASAVICGYKVVEIKTSPCGDLDLDHLKEKLSSRCAGIMLTNPSTLGVFERQIEEVAALVHEAGGLLYYDGANFNAIIGQVRPGDMGFDVMHMNLHKTFATPHGGGGPGSGPIAVSERLCPFLPTPTVLREGSDEEPSYRFSTIKDRPQSIGQLSAFMGNAGILFRAFLYIRMLGLEGLRRVSQFATLNANYLQKNLAKKGYELAYPERRATHEFVVTLKSILKEHNVSATDLAKRLLDYGHHAPTVYFPLLIKECLLIEPCETESKQSLDRFIEDMGTILKECKEQEALLHRAPHTMPVNRLDEVLAARKLELIYQNICD